jgi:putative nucleotidyltransferase with HDIG domain
MERASNDTAAQWMLLSVHSPGRNPVAAGIVLIDHGTNKLHVRIRSDFSDIDNDTAEVLECLADDLEEAAAELGARDLLARFESDWSHTLRLGRRHAFRAQKPSDAIQRIFEREVTGEETHRRLVMFPPAQLLALRESLPFSPAVALRAFAALREPSASMSLIEAVLAQDPAISAHLVRLANSALYSHGFEIRSISQALMQLGTDIAAWHVAALTIRKGYRAGHLREVWNHSIEVAQIARQICREIPSLPEQEVTLTALVHDIGQLCLLSLGEQFGRLADELRSHGDYPLEIERELCGTTHAEIGADLLADWSFPADMVAAVRSHHALQLSETMLSDVVYLAEALSNNEEDMVDVQEVASVFDRLGPASGSLPIKERHLEADFALLRFGAAA